MNVYIMHSRMWFSIVSVARESVHSKWVDHLYVRR